MSFTTRVNALLKSLLFTAAKPPVSSERLRRLSWDRRSESWKDCMNGKPVPSRDELVQTVMSLKPGTTVPMKVLRDKQEKTLNVTIGELNLDTEAQSPEDSDEQTEDTSAGFGMTLGNLTADRARRLELPAGTTGALIM